MRQDDGGESEEIPRGIMDEIRRREQISEDMRINGRSRVADKMKVAAESKAEISGEMALMFTNALCTPDNDSLCILCGVELAEGIPEDYIPISDPEKMKSLVLVDKFPAPYQCCRKLTTIDRDLSMKIFFGKCGHVYCGRCVNNIVRNSKQGQRNNKNKRRKINYDKVSIASLDFDDPDICAPSKCVAGDCNRAFRGNYYFRELYR
ncbi:hypothetical protein CANARDRAFT_199407 [[Candida] arabinofermentans NRRL YB-2248]|uniref:Zinc finger C3HC4 RING-type domain-containing protein n=1 Tax=[Candida] arabinofermentans NRRL YB-2248 TaxID=983967 RepID=A0A1E4T099_9ASCO|nr:hypothetical protein CANARDRAFT_199407 [[Candida] arabinofermentans NRRL YB-2248]